MEGTTTFSEGKFTNRLREHRAIVETLDEMLALAEGRSSNAGRHSAAAMPLLRLQLLTDELVDQVTMHFRAEEQTDLFAGFPEQFPRFSLALERLKYQHGQLLTELRRLRAALASTSGTTIAPQIAEQARIVITGIRRHEQAEDDLLQRAYVQDIGYVD
jgi:hypothetical protein